MNNINWVSSYPKSGNTWMRVFLINLLNPDLKKHAIRVMKHIPNAASRTMFDNYSGIDSSDLTELEIKELRPRVYESRSNSHKNQLFLKVHDKFEYLNNHNPLFPKAASNAVIYIIRNPLDVAVSFAKFKGISHERIIHEMLDDENRLAGLDGLRLKLQLPQLLSSWSSHIKSWTEQTEIPTIIIKYEDLSTQPLATFTRVVDFLNFNYSKEEICVAIEKSSFENLKKQEIKYGFQEKFANTDLFFRKGVTGEGEKKLTKNQIERLVRGSIEEMSTFNYLSS